MKKACVYASLFVFVSFFSILQRGYSVLFLEQMGKVRKGIKAQRAGNRQNRKVSVFQLGAGVIQFQIVDIGN